MGSEQHGKRAEEVEFNVITIINDGYTKKEDNHIINKICRTNNVSYVCYTIHNIIKQVASVS